MDIGFLVKVLEKLEAQGKQYFKYPDKPGNLVGHYTKMWTARSNKIEAREMLSRKTHLVQKIGSGLFQMLLDERVLEVIFIEDGLYKEEHCVLFPIGLEVIALLKELEPSTYVRSETVQELAEIAKHKFIEKAHIAVKERIQNPLLASGTLGAKPAIFSLFLILSGAVSQDTALILVEDEDKEIRFQDDLVKYLNYISQQVFCDSHLNRGKRFSTGDLSNFFRRRKDLVDHFGDIFKSENSFLYFDLCAAGGIPKKESLAIVMEMLIKGLEGHLQGEDGDLNIIIPELVQTFMVACPIKQTHRKALYAGDVDFNYYYQLQDIVNSFFVGIAFRD